MTDEINRDHSDYNAPEVLPPHKLAFIIDGTVIDIMHTDPRLAAVLLSEPKIIEITDLLEADPQSVQLNGTYDEHTRTFHPAPSTTPGVVTTPPAEDTTTQG
jgi:hypothetical protein